MDVSGSDVKNLLAIGTTLSFAIPAAGPVIAAALQGISMTIPPPGTPPINTLLAGLDDQFKKDQATEVLLLQYLGDQFGTQASNGSYQQLYDQAVSFVGSTSNTAALQTQLTQLMQDLLPSSGVGLKTSRADFSAKTDIWPAYYAIASSLLSLAAVYPAAEHYTQKKSDGTFVYSKITDASSVNLLIDLSSRYYSAALYYLNLAVIDRFRQVYYTSNYEGTPYGNETVITGVDHAAGIQDSNLNSDGDGRQWVVNQRQQVTADAYSVFSATDPRGAQWHAVLTKWYDLYANWFGYWNSQSAPPFPIAAGPTPITFDPSQHWLYTLQQVKDIDDHFWAADKLFVYYYTLTGPNGLESYPSVITTVQGSDTYCGCNLQVPEDLTQQAVLRRVYKTVIATGVNSGGDDADVTVDDHLVGQLSGWQAGTVADVVGIKE